MAGRLRDILGIVVCSLAASACAEDAGAGTDADGGAADAAAREADAADEADAAVPDGAVDAAVDAAAEGQAEVQAIFDAHCRECHVDGRSGGLSLAAPFTADTLGAPSALSPLHRIRPGDRERSFLYLKVAGRQGPSEGERMPMGRAPLSDEQIDRIGLFIDRLRP